MLPRSSRAVHLLMETNPVQTTATATGLGASILFRYGQRRKQLPEQIKSLIIGEPANFPTSKYYSTGCAT